MTLRTISGYLDPDVDNATEVTGVALTTSYANVASVTLSIPTHWNEWKCVAHATWLSDEDTGSATAAYDYRLRIDGTDQQECPGAEAPQNNRFPGAVVGRRTGMTTTGSRTVSLRAREVGGAVSLGFVALYARAVRTG